MNVDEKLKEVRALVWVVRCGAHNRYQVQDLAKAIHDLDQWLCTGGTWPEAWRKDAKNVEGMTWEEWRNAAQAFGAMPQESWRIAWHNGEDPAEYANG